MFVGQEPKSFLTKTKRGEFWKHEGETPYTRQTFSKNPGPGQYEHEKKKDDIKNKIMEAIENKDKKTLIQYFVRAKKSKLDPEIIKQAKKLIKDLPDEKEVVEEKIPEPPKAEPVVIKNVYTTSRRRR